MKKSSITLSAYDLRHSLTDEIKEKVKQVDRNNIHIILDNVVDAYNVGSAFRIADSIFAKKVWICGKNIVTPLDRQVKKSSVNTCDLIEWEALNNTVDIFDKSELSNAYFIAIEKTEADVNKTKIDFYGLKLINAVQGIDRKENSKPICLIVGSESFGISNSVLEKVNGILEIPMYGINNSMNVINALAITCSHFNW